MKVYESIQEVNSFMWTYGLNEKNQTLVLQELSTTNKGIGPTFNTSQSMEALQEGMTYCTELSLIVLQNLVHHLLLIPQHL